MAGVILEQVSRVYPGGVAAVSELDLEVFDREFLVLVGPSGCGKSTTLRMIAGLEPASAGRIRIAGQLVDGTPPGRRNIAMVFQGQALYPHRTVYRNLAFSLELRRRENWFKRVWQRLLGPRAVAGGGRREVARQEIDHRVRRAASLLGIEPLLARLPGELSGGERQRAALGRALVREPDVFLFDEPLSNLDAQLRAEMRRELKKLSRRLATTIVYVTHDQVEALTLGDRIAVLDRGKLQQLGPPAEVYGWPANRFVAAFIGSPPMNLIEGSFSEDAEERLRFGGGGWSASLDVRLRSELSREGLTCLDARPVVLGLRPENLRVAGAKQQASELAEWLPCEVTATELLGDAMILEVRPSGGGERKQPLLCKTGTDVGWNAGDQVRVGFDMRRAHWFDAQSGHNLCRPGGVRG